MKNIKTILFSLITATILSASSCKPEPIEPPLPENEEEIITTMILTLTDSADASKILTVTFRDADGLGGELPTKDSIVLDANKTYYCSMKLLDETKSPAADISEEVEEEANDHQLFYESNHITISYEDSDTNNPPLPLGLKTKWRTGNAGEGFVEVILKHQPNSKNNSMDSGETDIHLAFLSTIR